MLDSLFPDITPSAPKAKRMTVTPSGERQSVLLSGLDCLPGQNDLFPTDGPETPPAAPTATEPHYWYIQDDNGYSGWHYTSHGHHQPQLAGHAIPIATKSEAERIIDDYDLDRGIFSVTDVEPEPYEGF